MATVPKSTTIAKTAKPATPSAAVPAPKKPTTTAATAVKPTPKPTPAPVEAPKVVKKPPPKPVEPEPAASDDEDAELLALQKQVEELKRQKEAKKQQDAKAKEREKKKQELMAKLKALEEGDGSEEGDDGDADPEPAKAEGKKKKKPAAASDETKPLPPPKKPPAKKPKNPNAVESPLVDNGIEEKKKKKNNDQADDGAGEAPKPKRASKKEGGGTAAKKGPTSAEENAQLEESAFRALREKSNETLNAFENALPRYDNVVSYYQNSIYKNASNTTERMLLRLALPLQLGEISDEVVYTSVQANPKEIQQDIGGRDNSRLPETIRKHVVPVWFIPIEIFLARKPSGEIPDEFRLGKTDLNVPAAVKYMLDLIRDVKCTGARKQWMKTTIISSETYKRYWELVNQGVAFINAGNRYVSPEDADEKLETKIAQLDVEIASLSQQFAAAKQTFVAQSESGAEQTITQEAVVEIHQRHKACVDSRKALRALKAEQDAENKGRTIEEREYPAIFTYPLAAGDFYHVKSESAVIGSKTLRWSHLTPIKIKVVKRLVSGGHTLSRMSQKKRAALGIAETTLDLFRQFYTHVVEIGEYDYVSALNYRLDLAFDPKKQLLVLADASGKILSYPTFPLRYFIRMMDLIAKAPADSSGNPAKSIADISIHSGDEGDKNGKDDADDNDVETTVTPQKPKANGKKPPPPSAPVVANDEDNNEEAGEEKDENEGAAEPDDNEEVANDSDEGAGDDGEDNNDDDEAAQQDDAMDVVEPRERPKAVKRKAEDEPEAIEKSVTAPPAKKSRVADKSTKNGDEEEILESLDEMLEKAKPNSTNKVIKKPNLIDLAALDDDDDAGKNSTNHGDAMDIDAEDDKVVYSPDPRVNSLLTRIFGDKASGICEDPAELVMDEPGSDNLERLREEGRRLDALHKVHDFVRRYPNTTLMPSLMELEQALKALAVVGNHGKGVRVAGETISPTVMIKAAVLYINLCGVVFGTASNIRGPAFEEKFEPNLIDFLKSNDGQDTLADMITRVASSIKVYLSVLGHTLPSSAMATTSEEY